jgi:hypothetical protein
MIMQRLLSLAAARNAHHVSGGFCLCHALGGQAGKVAAALDATLGIPGALTVAYKHYALPGSDAGQRQWWRIHSVLQAAELILALPFICRFNT